MGCIPGSKQRRNSSAEDEVEEEVRVSPILVQNPERKSFKKPLISTDIQIEITYLQMLKDRRVFVAVISSTVAMIFMFFFDTILSDHLLDIGISDIDIGYFFALICFAYLISALIVNWLSKKMKRRFIT